MLTFQKGMKIDFPNTTQNLLYLGFKFPKYFQGLESEFCENLLKKSGFDAKITFCYFWIPSSEVRHF